MSSSTTKIISNAPICNITVYSKSRKNSVEFILFRLFFKNIYLQYLLLYDINSPIIISISNILHFLSKFTIAGIRRWEFHIGPQVCTIGRRATVKQAINSTAIVSTNMISEPVQYFKHFHKNGSLSFPFVGSD